MDSSMFVFEMLYETVKGNPDRVKHLKRQVQRWQETQHERTKKRMLEIAADDIQMVQFVAEFQRKCHRDLGMPDCELDQPIFNYNFRDDDGRVYCSYRFVSADPAPGPERINTDSALLPRPPGSRAGSRLPPEPIENVLPSQKQKAAIGTQPHPSNLDKKARQQNPVSLVGDIRPRFAWTKRSISTDEIIEHGFEVFELSTKHGTILAVFLCRDKTCNQPFRRCPTSINVAECCEHREGCREMARNPDKVHTIRQVSQGPFKFVLPPPPSELGPLTAKDWALHFKESIKAAAKTRDPADADPGRWDNTENSCSAYEHPEMASVFSEHWTQQQQQDKEGMQHEEENDGNTNNLRHADTLASHSQSSSLTSLASSARKAMNSSEDSTYHLTAIRGPSEGSMCDDLNSDSDHLDLELFEES